MNNGRHTTGGGITQFLYCSSLDMLAYWLFPIVNQSIRTILSQRGPTFLSGLWDGFLTSSWVLTLQGPDHDMSLWLIRDPTGTLTTCCTAFCPVAGLTGVAKLPEQLLNQMHMASVCSTKWKWQVCSHQIDMMDLWNYYQVLLLILRLSMDSSPPWDSNCHPLSLSVTLHIKKRMCIPLDQHDSLLTC